MNKQIIYLAIVLAIMSALTFTVGQSHDEPPELDEGQPRINYHHISGGTYFGGPIYSNYGAVGIASSGYSSAIHLGDGNRNTINIFTDNDTVVSILKSLARSKEGPTIKAWVLHPASDSVAANSTSSLKGKLLQAAALQ